MIKINTHHISPDEPLYVSGTESRDVLDIVYDPALPMKAVSDINYDLFATLAGRDLLVTGSASFVLEAECSRCSETTQKLMKTKKLCLLYENCSEQEVDITEDIREELLLEIPQKILCSEDCKGLCSSCGGDLNKDECKCNAKSSSVNNDDDNDNTNESPWAALEGLK